MRLGATGHQHPPPQALALWLRELEHIIAGPEAPTLGVCAGAEGADQLFATALLRRGIPLDLVIPCGGYEHTMRSEEARRAYASLRNAATSLTTLPFPSPSEEAFLAAGLVVVERSDRIAALWDGRPARGLGGTGDVVAYARTRGRPLSIVWPAGLVRA